MHKEKGKRRGHERLPAGRQGERVRVGDVVRITINGKEYYAKARAVVPPYCKLELPRYVPVDGKRVKVYVARLSEGRWVGGSVGR